MDKQMDSKVPKVRFRGFNVDWERKSLGDLCESLTYGLNAAAVKFDGENKYLRITDIDDDSRTFIKTGLTSPKVDLGASQDYLLRVGDIVFARTGASVGKSYLYKETDGRVFFAGFLIRARVKAGENAEFIFQNTLTRKYDAFVKLTSQRSGQPGINAKEYSSFSFLNPTETSEKNKIGTYFKELDRVIELHRHKHNKLVILKKAMLQKMLPQDGAFVPEIRFKGFDEDWRNTTLGEQVDITMGQSPLGCTYTENPKDFILVQGNADMKDGYVVPRVWTTQVTRMAHAGDLVLSVRAPVGDVGKSSYNIVLGRGVAGIKGNEFIYQSLLRMKMLGFWSRLSSGSTFDSINSDSIEFASLIVPCEVEQQKIGNYFLKLDELISQHSTQLNKLKQIKSACLERMFV